MDESRLTALIPRLEAYSEVNPRQYRLRVVLVAALGYAYLAAVVIGLMAIVVGSLLYVRFNALTIKVLWIPLVLVGLILRSLWITIPVPDGVPLNESDAKALFDLIRGLEKELNGPRVHTILVSDEMNAGIVQIPRFGMFGWLKNYLVVGLPLLSALRPDELRAVLVHEFGHLSGKHGRFSGWIYRVRESWTQILTAVHHERSYASFLFEPFLNWYAPFFKAYSFVLARRQEYEADALASKIAGKVTAARALVQIALTERSLNDEFWPAFYRGARERPQPPKDPFGQLVKQVGQSPPLKATKWLREELRIKTGYDDTHPSLADRLAAMGLNSESLNSPTMLRELVLSKSDEATAADYYINRVPEELVDKSNRLLREQIVESWRQRFTEIQEARKELAKLDEKAESEPLSTDEQWQRIMHLADVEEKEALLDPLRKLLAGASNHAGANFLLGVLLLEQGIAEGLKSVETAIELDPSYKGSGYGLISNFYLEQGEIEKSDDFRVRAEQYFDTMQRLNEQLFKLSPSDRFEPHGLNDDEIRELQKQLIHIRGLEHAFLVRKLVDQPMGFVFVLGVLAGFTWREGQNDKHINALLEELASTIQLSHPTVFVSLDAEHYVLPLMSKVAAANVFARQGVVEAGLEMRH